MNTALKASQSIEINATCESVWDTMTNPEKIKVYLYGTETNTDWKVGSPIVFKAITKVMFTMTKATYLK